jgi:hypothetical protein
LILYSDAHTEMLESNGQWITCIEYLHDKWKVNKENLSLFLKLAVNTWYTLTLDGPELSLNKDEYDALSQVLNESYSFFRTSFSNDENCQWLFGYMMTVRTDLFLNSGLEYTAIEQQGEALIEKAHRNGNMFAQLLYAMENYSNKNIKKCREKVKEHISDYFDESQEADKYFIEILTTDF